MFLKKQYILDSGGRNVIVLSENVRILDQFRKRVK